MSSQSTEEDSEKLESILQSIRALRGSVADLPQRAALCRAALELITREARPELWAELHFALGLCLIQMHTSEYAQNIEDVLDHFKQALLVFTPEHLPEKWASTQNNLGIAYRQRKFGVPTENQAEAIRCHERAFTIFTETNWPQDWADVTFNLANVYLQRINGVPKDNLDRAIKGYQATLQVYTQETLSLQWARVQIQLGRAWKNYRWNNYAANVEKAIEYYQAALSLLTEQEHPVEWSEAQHGFGAAWLSRENGVHDDNIVQAIQCFTEALKARRRETSPDDWADTMYNLGIAYSQSYHGSRVENVERAIRIFEEVLTLQTPEVAPLKSAQVTSRLADAYSQAIHGDRAAHLEYAIRLYWSVLHVQQRRGTAVDWGPTLHNLAVSVSERQLDDRITNLRQAATLGGLALLAFDSTNTPQEWATLKTDLIDILWKLANIERHDTPLAANQTMEDAITHGEDVLRVFEGLPLSHRQALAHYNLGNAYGDHVKGVRADNQAKAIGHYEQALQFYTDENYPLRWADTHNNLGVTYWERSDGDRAKNLACAIDHYNQALAALSSDASPILARRTAYNLGQLYFHEQRWREAVAAYLEAIQAAENLYRASLIRTSKEVELAEAADLYRHAAYAMARHGDYPGASVALEQGRARLLAEALERDRADLEKLAALEHTDLYNRYHAIANQIRNLANTELRSGNVISGTDSIAGSRLLHVELQNAIKDIRQIRGYENFFQSPTFEGIKHDLAADGVLAGVYLTVTKFGGVALIVYKGGVREVWLDLTETNVNTMLVRDASETAAGGYLFAQMGASPLKARWELDQVLPTLGEKILQPIAAALNDLLPANTTHTQNHTVTLIPTGRLALFPLHVAPYQLKGQQRCLIDDFTIIYAPSAHTLGHAREALASLSNVQPTFFGVGNPLPVQNASSLAFARPEVEEIANLFDEHAEALYETHATLAAVDARLGATKYLHLSCHGVFDARDPLRSRALLGGGDLMLKDIIAHPRLSRTRLAVLSACQTAIIDFNKLPDEAIGLPAGFFQAGLPGVIGTLWSVDDLSTALLMIKFYEYHLKGDPVEHISPMPPTEALRHAQIWLRDVTNAELDDLFAKYKANATNRPLIGMAHETVRREFTKYTLDSDREKQPFAHPYHWAPFVYYGV